MIQLILRVVVAVLTSFYLFPFQFTFLPMGYNTKKLMAVVGLGILLIQLAKKASFGWNKDVFLLSVSAFIVSLCGIASVIWNDTFDFTYASYIMSMWVWLGGAYTVVTLMHWVHGTISVRLLCNYLIAVCVAQCVLALTIDLYPPVRNFINGLYSDADYFQKHKRLYGLGAALDVAGSRFSAVLVMLAVLLVKWGGMMKKHILIMYLFSFLVIAVIGNMIARTTTVGLALSLLYLLYARKSMEGSVMEFSGKIWKYLLGSLIVGLPIVCYFYYTNDTIHTHIRFAFEGFFSLVEQGSWEVHSNDRLGEMIVFPDNLKTWLIGDGYFDSPLSNPYFTGVATTEYYMGTDVGYLRFIFYFGLIGLIAFIVYFLMAGHFCMKRFPQVKPIFVLLLLINFIVWFKVATDIFAVFALFLCISGEENEAYESQVCQVENK